MSFHSQEYQGEPAQAVPPEDGNGETLDPISFKTLLAIKPDLAEAIIDGILRLAGVATIIGGSKTRKSWLMAALIAAVLTGGTWLGHKVKQGRVLLIDGELPKSTIFYRLRKVFEWLGVSDEFADNLHIHALRGRTKDMPKALLATLARGPGYYTLIIIDPLSCFYPDEPSFSENSNSHMRRVYDEIITFASRIGSAVVLVHHLSKGNQSEKSVTDLGSGAGAVARSGDAHVGLRAHREAGVVVCDMVVREFPENAPTCWRWEFPVFVAAPDLNPMELAGPKPKGKKAEKSATVATMTVEEFAQRVLTNTPQIIEQIILAGKAYDLKEYATRGLLKIAIEKGLAYSHWEKGSNEPKRFSRIPPSPQKIPPIPPRCQKARGGRGISDRGRGRRSSMKAGLQRAGGDK